MADKDAFGRRHDNNGLLDSSNAIAKMDTTRTISELKSACIRAQVRILSDNFELPEDWRNYAVETDEDDLGDKVIADVLHKGDNTLPNVSCLK